MLSRKDLWSKKKYGGLLGYTLRSNALWNLDLDRSAISMASENLVARLILKAMEPSPKSCALMPPGTLNSIIANTNWLRRAQLSRGLLKDRDQSLRESSTFSKDSM